MVAPHWSKAETDYLVGLCNQYGCRFPVIADRYDPALGRSLVDLRERFHEVEMVLGQARQPTPVSTTAALPYYDADWDRKRRLQIESFQARPQAELQEELFVLEEVERVSRSLPRLLAHRQAVMLGYGNGAEWVTAEGLPPSLAEVAGLAAAGPAARKRSASAAGLSAAAPKQPKQAARKDRKRSLTPAAAGSLGPSRSQSTESVTKVGSAGPGRRPKPVTYPTSLSSARLTPIRVGLCRHVDRMILDYGLALRPAFATVAVMERLDQIRLLLAELADAKKAIEGGP